MSLVKSSYDVTQLRKSGEITAFIVNELGKMVKPGLSCAEFDRRARELCAEQGVRPAFLGLYDFPAAICVSVNDEVVHSIPHATKVLAEGDVVKLDFGVIYNGYFSDHCRTFPVGKISAIHQKLLEAGQAATDTAVQKAVAGNRIGDVSAAMWGTAEAAGFSIVTDYEGHGIGKKLHELPEIPTFSEAGTGMVLQENMVICVECQVCEKSAKLIHDRDGWTARTKDGGYAVMFERMIRVTKGQPEVFTRWSADE
jgi:methionyl aminopeptidase